MANVNQPKPHIVALLFYVVKRRLK